MKGKLIVVFVLLLIAFRAGAAAQTGVEETNRDAPAEVLGFEWKYQGYTGVETVRDESSVSSSKTKRGVVYVFKYTASLKLKNTAAKTIRAVEWNYVFVDPESRKELKRYKILSKQQIAPGEAQTLARDIFFDAKEPTRHLNTGKQRILLARIEYTDGSSWRITETKR
jgi:hypothetical protein